MTRPLLIPSPKQVTFHDGAFTAAAATHLRVGDHGESLRRLIIEPFAREMPGELRIHSADSGPTTGCISVSVKNARSSSEAYSLRIRPDAVTVDGDGPAGLFYGLQTLRQIATNEGSRWTCRDIVDAPDLAIRGVSLDVTRGRVPKRDTLRRIVDRLAALKINHLQLYVEHTFDFAFDADIARGCSPLTADDIRFLDAYCRDRFIELVPSLASFGHLGRILSLPRYRHLAEIRCTQPWESQDWPQRLRGLTIDTRSDEARALLEAMLDEYLPLFTSTSANVCADETHDLGCGRNRAHCDRVGRGRLYVDHLKFLAGVCAKHGKRMMFWGDIIRRHAELIGELPGDSMLLDWGYEADAEFPVVRSDARGDRKVCVCPGTGGWNRLINAMATADANIDHAVDVARRHGATGLIVTDWGDHGHFNQPACSWPAIARTAARAWNTESAGTEELDHAIESFLFGPQSRGRLPTLRKASQIGDSVETWPNFYRPIADCVQSPSITRDQAQELAGDAESALTTLRGDGEQEEWRLACEASVLLAEKFRMVHELRDNSQVSPRALRDFSARLDVFRERYEQRWLTDYRPHRLEDISTVLKNLATEARELARQSVKSSP